MEDSDVLASCKTVVNNRDLNASCHNPFELIQKLHSLVTEMAVPFVRKFIGCELINRNLYDDPFLELAAFQKDCMILQRELEFGNNSADVNHDGSLTSEAEKQFFKVFEEGLNLYNKCEELKSKYNGAEKN
jgi:hypothetical protein